MAQEHVEYILNGEPLKFNDAEIEITIDDIPEEFVYQILYGEPLWPDVIGDKATPDGR
jgi:hypothetical protein